MRNPGIPPVECRILAEGVEIESAPAIRSGIRKSRRNIPMNTRPCRLALPTSLLALMASVSALGADGGLGPRDVDALPASEPTLKAWYGDEALQYGELRLPEGDGPFPVAIVVHGGCWTVGFATARNTAPLASALAQRGIASWNVEYRQVGDDGGGWPGTFQDWAAAADHLRKLAADHLLDLSRVVVVGHSAGGHAALWLAARPGLPDDSEIRGDDPLPVQAAVNVDGPAGLASFVGFDEQVCGKPVVAPLMEGTPAQQPVHYAQGDPMALAPAGVPQYLVQVGVLTPEDAASFRDRFDTMAAPVEILAVSESGHFDVIAPGTKPGDAVVDLVVRSLAGRTEP